MDQLTREPGRRSGRLVSLLLACGIVSSVLYTAMLAIIPLQWESYSSAAQTVSELSAIGAPTRSLWVPLTIVWALLYVLFGWGVWKAAGRSRSLRIAGAVIMAHSMFGIFWPPMHLRGTEPTLTDTLHIAWTIVTVLLIVLAIGFAAAALGRGFRLYSMTTLVVFIVFGTLSGVDGPRIAANLPTPWIGVWERANIGAWLLWIVVMAIALLRRTCAVQSLGLEARPWARRLPVRRRAAG
jgi:hypothetical protein